MNAPANYCIIQGDEVERQVSVRKRLQFQHQQAVDDDESTAVLRHRGAQSRVSWSHNVIYVNSSVIVIAGLILLLFIYLLLLFLL